MKKTAIILSVFVVILSGCKPKTSSANLQATFLQTDTLNNQQELTQKDTNQDSLYLLQLEDEFNSHPLVSAEEVARIAPVIKKWTKFYKLDFAKARLVNVSTECFNCVQDDKDNLYYYKINKEEDTDKKIGVDYSPNRQLYVSFISTLEKNGKYYHIGWDDSQNVWLIDRKQKHATTILFHGVGGLTEGAFWKSNDTFIVVSCDYKEQPFIRYMVDVFDIAKQTQTSYQIMREGKEDFSNGYVYEVYFKEKGIIAD